VPFIDANGVSLHFALAGQHGPSVVLLHELGGTMNSWNKVAPRLAARYRVLRYDQRGSWWSPAATTPCARMPEAPTWQRRYPVRASS